MKKQIENRVANTFEAVQRASPKDSSIGIGRTSRSEAFDRLVDAIDDLGQFWDPSEAIRNTDFDIFTAERAQGAFGDEQQIIRSGEPIDENAPASRARSHR